MTQFLSTFFKGVAMGAANVIPGVSGGTIALITNIFEDLIDSLKSFNSIAFNLLLSRQFKPLLKHINFKLLGPVFLGVIVSIFSLAKLFEFLLEQYPKETWSFFFGLVLASVYYVGKRINRWDYKTYMFFFVGVSIASFISFANPTPIENTNLIFIFICGLIGITGMILPGLSGSYILMLMGNYQLLMVDSINALFDFLRAFLSGEFDVLIQKPEISQMLLYFIIFVIGSIVGIIAFARLISFVFKRYTYQTLAVLTGFVFGSLSIVWPWKKENYDFSKLNRDGEAQIIGFERYLPDLSNISELIVLSMMIIGIIAIILVEKLAAKETK